LNGKIDKILKIRPINFLKILAKGKSKQNHFIEEILMIMKLKITKKSQRRFTLIEISENPDTFAPWKT